jgi:hypothetical protein
MPHPGKLTHSRTHRANQARQISFATGTHGLRYFGFWAKEGLKIRSEGVKPGPGGPGGPGGGAFRASIKRYSQGLYDFNKRMFTFIAGTLKSTK